MLLKGAPGHTFPACQVSWGFIHPIYLIIMTHWFPKLESYFQEQPNVIVAKTHTRQSWMQCSNVTDKKIQD